MLPNLLILGFAAGLLAHRARTLILWIIGFSAGWALLIASMATSEPSGVSVAFLLAAANASIGMFFGMAIRLLVIAARRPA